MRTSSFAIMSCAARRALWAAGPKAWALGANAQGAWDLRRPPTLAATCVSKFSTPPTLTTSTDLVQNVPLYVITNVAGVQGVAEGNVSLDGGRSLVFSGVYPAALPLPGTPLTLNFGAGVFGLSDVYQMGIASWTDFVNGHVMLPPSNLAVLETKGAHDPSQHDIFARDTTGAMRQFTAAFEARMYLNSTLGPNVFSAGAGGQSWTVMSLFQLRGSLVAGADTASVGAGSGNASNVPLLTLGHNGAGAWRCSVTNDAGVNTIIDVGSTNHSLNLLTWSYDNVAHTLRTRLNGVQVASSALNIGAVTLAQVALGGRRRRGGGVPIDSSFLNGCQSAAWFWNATGTDAELAANESLIMDFYRPGNIFQDVNLVAIGDSQTDAGRILTWLWQLLAENDTDANTSGSSNGPVINNLAISGNDVATATTNAAQLAAMAAAFVPGKRNILINMIGQNDIDPAATGNVATLISNYNLMLSQEAAAGFTNIINVTMPPAGIPVLAAYTAKQATFDAYLATVTAPGKLVNVSNVPGVPGDGVNFVAGDTRHYTRQGYAAISDLVQPAYRFAVHGTF